MGGSKPNDRGTGLTVYRYMYVGEPNVVMRMDVSVSNLPPVSPRCQASLSTLFYHPVHVHPAVVLSQLCFIILSMFTRQ